MSTSPKQKQLSEQLENLTAFDIGVVYGKEDAWERLQNGLPKQRKKRRISIWAGATAIAALLLVLCWLLPGKLTDTLHENQENAAGIAAQAVTSPFPDKDEVRKVQMVVPVAAAPGTQQQPHKAFSGTSIAQGEAQQSSISAAVDTVLAAPIVDTAIVTIAQTTTVILNVPVAARLAKLPVVHLNELPHADNGPENGYPLRNNISVRFLGGFRDNQGSDPSAGILTVQIRR